MEPIITTQSNVSSGAGIVIEPNDVSAKLGSYVNISAVVSTRNASFQWYNSDGQPMYNQNESNMLIGPITECDYGFYRLSILDLISNEFTLTRWVEVIDTTPRLIQRPQGGVFKKGETIRLTAHFENAKYYQWYQDGKKIEDCTGNTLIIDNAILKNTGSFSLVAANKDYETSIITTDIKIV